MKFTAVSPQFTEKFFALTDKASHIAVTAHVSPDDDSIASVLSVFDILTERYPEKHIRAIYSAVPQDQYRTFKNYGKIEFCPDISAVLGETDLLIGLDGGQFSRFSGEPEKLKQIANTICIDHHSSPIDDFTLSLVVPTLSSCAQLVYIALCPQRQVSPELAEIFLLGILGDTGNFAYLKLNQTETLIIAKQLIDISQIEIQEFLSRYRGIPLRVFEITKELMKNTRFLTAPNWPDFQYSFLDKSFKDDGAYSDSEISNASGIYVTHFLRTIVGNSWGFVITPKAVNDCSISARSLPNTVSVRDIMERMKIGGGHDRAAGGTFKNSDVDGSLDQIISWLNTNQPLKV